MTTLAACFVMAFALALGTAHAQPPDSSLHRFLGRMADSTDAYFGPVAAPTDTAGFDSTLQARLDEPWEGQRRQRTELAPRYSFNRVDGSVWGGGFARNDRAARLRVAADLAWAQGGRRWLGGGELQHWGRLRIGAYERVRLRGGWRTASMDRDHDERLFATLKALVTGNDRQHYLRRDGWSVEGIVRRRGWHAGLELRDWIDGPRAVTTTWVLAGGTLAQPGNIAAAAGRSREIGVEAGVRLPLVPLRATVAHDLASRSLGGDFEFQRTRVTLGGELPVTRVLSALPQLVYGRLTGDPVPQAAFYLGGPRTLRSLPSTALGGTGLGLARFDVIGAFDVLERARVPHPAWLPVQVGAFAAVGAVWGVDPFGGPGSPRGDWPGRRAWLGEAGLGVLYRPGIPDGDGYLRIEHAWPLGPGDRGPRWSIGYTRALELLPGF
jgi:hypothetical protein